MEWKYVCVLESAIIHYSTTLHVRFSGFKKFVTGSVFGELQLTQISLNFKNSCCSLKISGVGATLCVAFLLF